MLKKNVTIKAKDGIDARAIALTVQAASQYASQVHIQVATKKINAKSIMGMMSLRLSKGEEIAIITEGEEEEKALEGLSDFFEALA